MLMLQTWGVCIYDRKLPFLVACIARNNTRILFGKEMGQGLDVSIKLNLKFSFQKTQFRLLSFRERSKIKKRLNLGHCPIRGGGGVTDHQNVPTFILIFLKMVNETKLPETCNK